MIVFWINTNHFDAFAKRIGRDRGMPHPFMHSIEAIARRASQIMSA